MPVQETDLHNLSLSSPFRTAVLERVTFACGKEILSFLSIPLSDTGKRCGAALETLSTAGSLSAQILLKELGARELSRALPSEEETL